ncbi:MAG: NAD-dependent epimerase/dehydratase family protein, partial [Candidatus Heimdallarchaeaceae archaeon]
MRKRVVVTGAAGFLGSYIVKNLLKNGDYLVAVDINKLKINHPNMKVIIGDINNEEILLEAMKNVDEVYHLAAIADIDDTRLQPVETMETNVVGTAKCLNAARKSGVKRFVFASSVYVGGSMGSFYGISKQIGEALCKTFFEEFGLPYTICRYGSLYGRGANRWNMIYKLCRALLTKKEFEFWGNGEEIREFIHIEDAARETVRVARDPKYRNTTVLITGHQRMKMKDFFSMVEEMTHLENAIKYKDDRECKHYKRTPYTFCPDLPIRINMNHYIDISEGILDCLKEAAEEENKRHNTT